MIRNVQLIDIPAILNIYAPYVVHTAITFDLEVPSLKEMEERVLSIMKDYPFLVVEEEGIILGYAYGHVFYAKEAYYKSVEVTIYMDQKHKRKGLGSALYKELERRLKAQGRENLFACIAYSEDEKDPYLNRDSILFHQRNGYVQCGHFHRSGSKFNRTYDTVYMEKHL